MPALLTLVLSHEALLLFAVLLVGLVLARLSIGHVKLGLAGVLFSGLAFGALAQGHGATATISPAIKELGLILFVYAVGLTSGAGFFSAFRTRGVRLNLALLGVLIGSATLLFVLGRLLGIRNSLLAGVFSGALTNTPALGAASEALAGTRFALDPVLGYSVSYPIGVLGALFVFRVFVNRNKDALEEEREALAPKSKTTICTASCLVTRDEVCRSPVGELAVRSKFGVLISRVLRGREVIVPNKYTLLQPGDILTLVGSEHAVRLAVPEFGETSAVHPDVDREKIDMRRILVSRRNIGGQRLESLSLDRRFGAQVTRVRRADIDLVPSPEFRIEVGDRLRVVAPRDKLPAIAQYFGDSERELAEVDFVALALGLTLGLLLGTIEVQLFGSEVSLGTAGGPLLVALVLGRIGRFGSLTFSLPFETSVVLRELGLLLFLAGVGVSAGAQLSQVMNREGLILLALGALVTIVSSVALLLVLRRAQHASVTTALGATSGMQTQPATLAAAYEMSGKSEETYVAYAMVYPVAMIGKIIIAQLIATLPSL